ncbi:MAG: PIN domain-containing protein [Candidatus Poribacteria bacterium]|nr:PIN domain-containing protein [Candidatus Poribacteria bacterium]
MSDAFADTNLFLRFLTNDVPKQADAVADLLARAANGEVTLRTHPMVIAEIVWTLESYYELPKAEIASKVLAVLNTPGLQVEDTEIIGQAALTYAEKNIDFIDAYSACWMIRNGISHAYTFDTRHFSRVEGVVAESPQAHS